MRLEINYGNESDSMKKIDEQSILKYDKGKLALKYFYLNKLSSGL